MKEHFVKVKSVDKVTHDVLRIVTDKPQQYTFKSGQATEVAINKNGWKSKKRPFTFTCLPTDDYLEFTTKTYPSHKGVTEQLLQLKKDDELILHDVFGAIAYKGEGIFIAVFRYLQSKKEIGNNKLIFANKTKADIILEKEFKKLLGNNFINILSDEKVQGYAHGQITENFIKSNSNRLKKIFYVCGPPPMMDAIEKQLANLHVSEESIVKEAF